MFEKSLICVWEIVDLCLRNRWSLFEKSLICVWEIVDLCFRNRWSVFEKSFLKINTNRWSYVLCSHSFSDWVEIKTCMICVLSGFLYFLFVEVEWSVFSDSLVFFAFHLCKLGDLYSLSFSLLFIYVSWVICSLSLYLLLIC